MPCHPLTDENGRLIGYACTRGNRQRNVQDTSREAYSKTAHERTTQERQLFRLYREHPEGLNDREVAEQMGWTPAHASARRNGMAGQLEDTEWELYKVRKDKDAETHKSVWHWGVRKISKDKQGNLF